jgi:ATP-dependent exoDNAse (exonuclease V) alpha subunit
MKKLKEKLEILQKQLDECCFTEFIDLQNEFNKLQAKINHEELKLELKNKCLTNEQKDVFNNVVSNIKDIISINMPWDNMIAIKGSAGVGKTFTTAMIIKELVKLKYKITLTTPTHKSLQVANKMIIENGITKVEAKTIHSFLSLKLQTNFNTGVQKFVPEYKNSDKTKTDILIVDESSMISLELFEHIQETIKNQRVKAVIFVGDYYQLPPVDSEILDVFSFSKEYKLSKIVRQAQDSYIIKIASHIKDRIKNQDFINILDIFKPHQKELKIFNNQKEFLDDFFCNKDKKWYEKNQIITAYTNNEVDFYNKIARQKYWQDNKNETPQEYQKSDKIIFQSPNVQKEKIIHQNNEEVTIKVAKKEFDANLKINYYYCIDTNNKSFKVVDSQSKQEFNKYLDNLVKKAKQLKGNSSSQIWKKFYEIKETFCEVKYSFASTIHKLQGSTLQTVYIDLNQILKAFEYQNQEFVYRLLYVAVTRASMDIKILI